MSRADPAILDREEEARQLEAEACRLAAQVHKLLERAAELRAGGPTVLAKGTQDVGDPHVARDERVGGGDNGASGASSKVEVQPPNQATVLPALLSVAEAAQLLGLSIPALRKRVQRSQLPRGAVVQTGRRYKLRRDRLLPPQRL